MATSQKTKLAEVHALVFVLVFAVIVGIVYVWQNVVPASQNTDDTAALSSSNPPSGLSDEQIKSRQALLVANPPSNLTAAQIKARQALLQK